ncbi:MAG TPA: DUF2157 domain-containing protein [Acidimicrobiia bacterium]|nr:DUF2157 domain-containing protein [Acidimicrobiia bacterium]
MFTLLPLLVIVVIVVVWAVRPRSEPRVPLPTGPMALEAVLRRWVDDGLIHAEQAAAILAHERPAAARLPRRRLPIAMEALGYLGGVLGLVGATLLVAPSWEDLGFGAQVAILAGSAAGFFAAGAALRTATAPLERLREFLWLLSTGATAGALAVVGVDGFDLDERGVALLTAGGAGVVSFALWQLRDRPLQHMTAFVSLTVVAAVSATYAADGSGLTGLAIFLVGALWLAASRFELVPPQLVGAGLGVVGVFVGCVATSGTWAAVGGLLLVGSGAIGLAFAHRGAARPDTVWTALGALGALVGAAIVAGDWPDLAPLFGLAIATTFVGIGVAQRERATAGVQLALGIVGLFAFLPWAMLDLFGNALGPPAVLMITGAVLLAVAVVVLRRQGGDPGTKPPRSRSVRVA